MLEGVDRQTYAESQIINQRDLDYIKTITDVGQRKVVVCCLITHRRPDHLAVGDPVPPLELTEWGSSGELKTVKLAAPSDQPLVLIFGSYT